MDMPPVFRRQAAQVENRDLDVGRSGEHFARDFDEAIGFGHLAGTGVLAAGRAIDQENGRRAALVVTALRIRYCGARVQPIDRQLMLGSANSLPALRVCGLLRWPS
jgi:hypothetical protein